MTTSNLTCSPLHPHRLSLWLGICALVGLMAVLFLYTVNDPLVDFEGRVMRQSDMRASSTSPIYCQQMASFSFGVWYTCFDSEAELEAFADNR